MREAADSCVELLKSPPSPSASFGHMDDAKLTRRGSLAGMAGLLLGLVGWRAAGSEGASPAGVASGAVSCVLTPEQTEGPYYIAGEKYRRTITEGRPGIPLYLRL